MTTRTTSTPSTSCIHRVGRAYLKLRGVMPLIGSESRSGTVLGAACTYKYGALYSHAQSPHIKNITTYVSEAHTYKYIYQLWACDILCPCARLHLVSKSSVHDSAGHFLHKLHFPFEYCCNVVGLHFVEASSGIYPLMVTQGESSLENRPRPRTFSRRLQSLATT
jgi:hypothetical protein